MIDLPIEREVKDRFKVWGQSNWRMELPRIVTVKRSEEGPEVGVLEQFGSGVCRTPGGGREQTAKSAV